MGQVLVFGLSMGAIYALMALAIGMIYSTSRILNFCHASIIMIGAMVSYYAMANYNINYICGLIISIVVNIILQIAIYFICIKGLKNLQSNTNWIITLFGMSVLLNNGARLIFGANQAPFPYLFGGKAVTIGHTNILWHEIFTIAFVILIGILYELFCSRTKYGRALRAVSYKPETAKLMGINSEMVMLVCFMGAGVLASIGGVLISPTTFVSYTMTSTIGLKGYAAALIGGIGNTKGAFIGGFLLGLIECIITLFIPATLKDAASFLIMIIVIIFLPGGILSANVFTKGKSTSEKV